ncbi:MAG: PAAR domain-containing protein [Pirellulaceae bacterium]|nr:PAAR domain-containing protein [Pirellulaceae bacterium]
MPAAARVGDMIKQDAPHCHAPIHPLVPSAHPAIPLQIIKGAGNVLIGGKPAARVGDLSKPCMLPPCVPGGPGIIAKGSGTVLIAKQPAARANDLTAHAACVAPIPSPVGKVLPPCCTSVMIGG